MRYVSLLSGGLDSVVATTAAAREGRVELALTFDYGQRAAPAEVGAAAAACRELGVPHRVIDLPWLSEVTGTALVKRTAALPELASDELDDPSLTRASATAVWVPNRNGVFINVAAAFAENLSCEAVVCGFNAEEGRTFPDNTPEFAAAATAALRYSTANAVRVVSPTQHLTKPEIVALGRRLSAPLAKIWSCYGAGPEPCGKCESCLRLQRALAAAQP
ncbi:MAG: 7-cyano-7-deazaguanine synthase QueC [Armatimonadetes bacterium]|nr:7-cyano-7-deazaguanine synthase QueC [Armatimonadota bacterium]